jgi:eukaryotic-like serine/threonine-protein kinase
MSDLKVGSIIDRYVVEGLLGQGGMAVVYRVRHKDLDSIHALKVLTVHSESIRERLRLEGKAQAKLRHVNIVSVTDLVDVRGAPGLIMECVEGPDLSHVMPLIKGDLELADTLARGIISGVAEAHRLGMVHRDLKPANILIAKQGERPVPKVTDFGLVKVIMAEGEGSDRTQAGSTMGTPAYMAPEQIRDPRLVDARADLFSLGCILYELVCGTKPFQGNDMLELFTAITSGTYRPPKELNPQLPDRMERAIMGALEVQREQRIPDCRVLFEVWEGRLVDWKAMSLDKPSGADPRWESVLSSAWGEGAEQSASMTAVPSSLEQGTAGTAQLGSQRSLETYYDDEAPDSEPAAVEPDPAGPDETFYHPPPRTEDELPSEGVVPAAGHSDPSDPEPAATKRGALPWALGVAALLALAVGGGLLMRDRGPADPAPATAASDQPAPEPAPTQPDVTQPQPETLEELEPTTAEVLPEEALEAQPELTSAPAPTAPAAAPQPEHVPDPEPVEPDVLQTVPVADAAVAETPEAEPVAAPTTATVTVEGGLRIWLVGSAGRFPAGEVPPGSYTIKAFFDPMAPIDAGSFDAAVGAHYTVQCSTAMQRCTAAPR